MAYEPELEELKSRLRITWADEDDELNKILVRSKHYIDKKTGVSIDYTTDFDALELVLERARYVYNNAADLFVVNFADDLLDLQIRCAVKDWEASQNDTTT